MNENNKNELEITKDSLIKLNNIIEYMEGDTFHKHTHILYDIRTKLGKDKINYLEIGSYAGASISLISSHYFPTNCYSLDLGFPIPQNVVENNVSKFRNVESNFTYIKGNSQNEEIITYVKKTIKDIDILFIDGDHSLNGVYNDFYNYVELVKSGGYIAFDDYLDNKFSPEVKPSVDNIVLKLDSNQYEIIGLVKYDYLKEFTDLDYNNIFLIKKK